MCQQWLVQKHDWPSLKQCHLNNTLDTYYVFLSKGGDFVSGKLSGIMSSKQVKKSCVIQLCADVVKDNII